MPGFSSSHLSDITMSKVDVLLEVNGEERRGEERRGEERRWGGVMRAS